MRVAAEVPQAGTEGDLGLQVSVRIEHGWKGGRRGRNVDKKTKRKQHGSQDENSNSDLCKQPV